MTIDVVLVPGAPVLVPELAGSASRQTAHIRSSALRLLAEASTGGRPVMVTGVDPSGRSHGDGSGSLRRWGVAVPVGTGSPFVPSAVSDPALIAWWLLDRAGHRGPRRFRSEPPRDEHPGPGGPGSGGESDREGLLLVVADGPAALAPRAPIPRKPEAVRLDAELADWILSGGDLPDPGRDTADALGWWSRPAWRVLASAVRDLQVVPGSCSDAPFGVGYHVAGWGSR